MSSENPGPKKPSPRAAKLLSKLPPPVLKDDAARKVYPNLLDVLLPIYESGTLVRQPGRMAIAPDGGHWRVSIECPTEGLQTVIVCDSLASLLDEVEKALAAPGTVWTMSWKKRQKNLPTLDDLIK